MKRDIKNFINPVNYISPLLDWAGYGFNLYVIAKKPPSAPKTTAKRKMFLLSFLLLHQI